MTNTVFSGTPSDSAATALTAAGLASDGAFHYNQSGNGIAQSVGTGFSQATRPSVIISGPRMISAAINKLFEGTAHEFGLCFVDDDQTGVSVIIAGTLMTIRTEVAGMPGSTIATGAIPDEVGGSMPSLFLDTATGSVIAYMGGASVASGTYGGTVVGLHPGFQIYRASGGEVFSLLSFNDDAPIASITTLAATLRPGEIYAIEAELNDIDAAASSFGTKALAAANAPDGVGTVTIANWVHGQLYDDLPGTKTFTAVDIDDLSAAASRTMGYPIDEQSDTLQYYDSIVLGSDVDTGEDSLGSDPAIVQGCRIFWPNLEGGSIADTGLRVNVPFGVYPNFWMRDTDGYMWKFSVTIIEIGEGGEVDYSPGTLQLTGIPLTGAPIGALQLAGIGI